MDEHEHIRLDKDAVFEHRNISVCNPLFLRVIKIRSVLADAFSILAFLRMYFNQTCEQEFVLFVLFGVFNDVDKIPESHIELDLLIYFVYLLYHHFSLVEHSKGTHDVKEEPETD